MARLNRIGKTKKEHTCRVCGGTIPKGDPYVYMTPRYKPKIDAHEGCPIPQRLYSSSKMVEVWDAQEAVGKAGDDVESKMEALRGLAESARSVGDEYQTSCDSQREYFPDSETAQENEDKAIGLTEWADELDTAVEKLQEIVDGLNEVDDLMSKADDCPE